MIAPSAVAPAAMAVLAVKTTVWPAFAGFALLLNVTTVPICWIVSVNAAEALLALAASPL